MKNEDKILLIGDNPFHGISHLSQERRRDRGDETTSPEYAAKIIDLSIQNGADGFMFSVSEKTLSILRILRENRENRDLRLYAIIPYAYEYVKMSSTLGGLPSLTKRVIREVIFSENIRAAALALNGILRLDLKSLIKTYLLYELHRIKRSIGRRMSIESVLLHQILTDLCLSLNLEWIFEHYIEFLLKTGITPGFNTGNFTLLVERFKEWNICLNDIIIAAPFNKVGFQMVPSKEECEKSLKELTKPNVLAISILAAGYLKPEEAIDYVVGLPNIKGVAVGVSKEKHAIETFRLLKKKLKTSSEELLSA